MLAISTSWMNEDGAADLPRWVAFIRNLGFEAVELSYKVDRDQLACFERLLPVTGVKVSSIHNFCPTPDDGPSCRHGSNYYRLSALDEEERRAAVRWTKTAIDTACRTGAGVVVIHAGTLDFEDERSPRLFALYADGKKETTAFVEEKQRILGLREQRKAPHIEALDQSLDEVCAYAGECGIRIGLETRYYPLEIPNFEEIDYFLRRYGPEVMGYWHDFGHAEMNSRLGITPHQRFLRAYGDRLIGAHIHGIKGRRDHLAPFEGDMDLEVFAEYLTEEVIRVVEAKPFASEALMREAVARLKRN